MRCKSLFVLVISVFLFGIISASIEFSQNGSSIKTQYEPQDYLQADLNMSFSGEHLNSTFSDSLGNSITLSELLYQNPGYYYIFNDLSNATISSAHQIINFGETNFLINASAGNLNYQLRFNGNIVFNTEFLIVSSENTIEETLALNRAYLNATKKDIAKSDLFVQAIANEFLNISYIENRLSELEIQSQVAGTSQEYTDILNALSSLKIPHGIAETINTNSIIFYPEQKQINLDALIEVAGGEYPSKEEKYLNAVYSWNDENLRTGLTFREILIIYNASEQIALKIFQFEFDKRNLNEDAYFLVKDMENLKFEDTISSMMGETSSGYFYINIKDLSENIVFSTTEEINFLDVPAFISPPIGNLHPSIIPPFSEWKDNKKAKWILFGIIAFILLMIGIVTYSLLQLWYRRRYEAHLFKNRNNMYNIMNYIQIEKKKGTPREEVLKNLRKTGWTAEQIDYAMRKYEGRKITGIIQKPMNMPAKTEKPGERKPIGLFQKPLVSSAQKPGQPAQNTMPVLQPPTQQPKPMPFQPAVNPMQSQLQQNKPMLPQQTPMQAKPMQPQLPPLQSPQTNKPLYKTFNLFGAEKKPEEKPKEDSNTKV